MVQRIFEPSVSFNSPVNFMCNNMGFLKNLHSCDFGGHFLGRKPERPSTATLKFSRTPYDEDQDGDDDV